MKSKIVTIVYVGIYEAQDTITEFYKYFVLKIKLRKYAMGLENFF